jgi:RES domain-containing protein
VKNSFRESLTERLRRIRPIKIKSIWVSATPFIELCQNNPPDWLYCSCKPGRYNPKNIACVYFAENDRTAKAEHFCNDDSGRQPLVYYNIEVSLARVLDLTNPKNLKELKLARARLFEEWEDKKEVATQLIGEAVAQSQEFSAILFPSAAAKEAGFQGKNLIVFRDSIKRPDFVRVLGPTKRPLQKWP